MILTDNGIKLAILRKQILIAPFDEKNLGSNSYDVHLSENLAMYTDKTIDAKKDNLIKHFKIPKQGFVLKPGTLYLGTTEEYTETHKQVPFLEGKSSTGRLGISIHATAGKGDVGFCGIWTLEISTSHAVRIYAGMPIGQLIYFEAKGKVLTPYNKKGSAKYNNRDFRPMGSRMWKNFLK